VSSNHPQKPGKSPAFDFVLKFAGEEIMKRFTLFTFLYLALGVCLTAIALGYPNLPSGLQTSLFISAGVSYLVCLFSTFPFWRETAIRFYRSRSSLVIVPWLVIGFTIVWMIWEVQSQNWMMEAILQALSWLLVVLLQAELIVDYKASEF
jgi:hypothetical protein